VAEAWFPPVFAAIGQECLLQVKAYTLFHFPAANPTVPQLVFMYNTSMSFPVVFIAV